MTFIVFPDEIVIKVVLFPRLELDIETATLFVIMFPLVIVTPLSITPLPPLVLIEPLIVPPVMFTVLLRA